MKRLLQPLLAAAILPLLVPTGAWAAGADDASAVVQGAEIPVAGGTVIVPASSAVKASDAGIRVHTNFRIFKPEGWLQPSISHQIMQTTIPPGAGYYETPASLACIYGFAPAVSGCNPRVLAQTATGGSAVVAIVDAFDYPGALGDLEIYSQQFGLPIPTAATLQRVVAGKQTPGTDPGGWNIEAALDIQMVHAMAPSAKIILVEALSSSYTDMLAAEDLASAKVHAVGAGEVSNSWGSIEFAGETAFDSHFAKPGVVYFASTGDDPGTSYPAASPKVVAVGGTSTSRSPVSGLYVGSEAAWADGGGGTSPFYTRPSYQNGIAAIVGNHRGMPDISAVANPVTGVWVYNAAAGGWLIVGGTSASAPLVAGMVNNAGRFHSTSATQLTATYGFFRTSPGVFHDVTRGICGPYAGYSAKPGYEYCTGIGSPKGKGGL